MGRINDDNVSDRGTAVIDAVATSGGGGGGGIAAAGIAIGSWLASRGVTPPPPPAPSTSESLPGPGLGDTFEPIQMSTPQRNSSYHRNASPSPLRSEPGLAPGPGHGMSPHHHDNNYYNNSIVHTPSHRDSLSSSMSMGTTPTSRTGTGLWPPRSTRSLGSGLSNPGNGGGGGLSFHQPRSPDSSNPNNHMYVHHDNRDDSPIGGGGGGGASSRHTRERSVSNVPSLLFSSLVHPPTSHSSPQSLHEMHMPMPSPYHHHVSLPGQGMTPHGGYGGGGGGGNTRPRSSSSTPPSPGGLLMGQPIGPEVLLTALSLSMADDAESLAMVV